jgi:hypothetical protein
MLRQRYQTGHMAALSSSQRSQVVPQSQSNLESFRLQWNKEIRLRYPGRPANAPAPLPAGQTTIITALNGGLIIRPL